MTETTPSVAPAEFSSTRPGATPTPAGGLLPEEGLVTMVRLVLTE
jgi:hypothetical protein